MQLFFAALVGALVSSLGTIVGQVLVSLGIGYAVYTGVDASILWAKNFTLSQFAGLPSQALQIAGTLQLGRCISILTSALVMRMTLQGLKSGAIKRMQVK